MKILHVIAQLPSRTGSGVYFTNMIEEFKRYNHEQRAVYALQDDFTWTVLGEEESFPVFFKSQDLDFPIVGMSDVMPYDNTLYSDMDEEMIEVWKDKFIRALERAREDFKPDIIFAHHLWMLTSIVREVFPQEKIIGLCHNTDLRQARMNPHLKEKYVRNIDRLDYVFAASEEQKDEIVESYGLDRERIRAVGGGFNQKNFYPGQKRENDGKVKLVYCAKIDPSKGIYELLDVYKSLDMDDISLDIIGSPNEENREKLEEYMAGDKSIRLYNVKDQEALGHELRKKDIFLMPSYYEGLGLMAIESLASGLYVVTTEIEALMTLLGQEIKDSGVIKYVPLPRIYNVDKPVEEDLPAFKENLRRAIIEQVEKVRRKEEFSPEIGEAIRSFSWQGLVGRMNEFIESL